MPKVRWSDAADCLHHRGRTDQVSVITQFDGLMFTLRDGQGGKDLQQNGTGIATGAVLAMSD